MADAAFTARATTKAHVVAEISKLRLPTVNGQDTHDTATQRASSNPNVTVPPAITTRPDAIDAADRVNNLTQSVIGAKEGATEAVTAKVRARVTDTVLRTSTDL